MSQTASLVVGGVGAVTMSFFDDITSQQGGGSRMDRRDYMRAVQRSAVYNDPFIGFYSHQRTGGSEQNILESAPLDSPLVCEINGGSKDALACFGGSVTKDEFSTLYEKFSKDLKAGETDKFESALSITDVKNPDLIIGFHYANWCIYCKDMKSKWGEILSGVRKENIAVIAINEERNRNPIITTIPTIIMYNVKTGLAEKYYGKSKPKKILKWVFAS